MTTRNFISCAFAALLSIYASSDAAARDLIPIQGLDLQVKRHLVSADGNIFLDIYTGTWKSHGLLQIKNQRFVSSFEGLQKGTKLDLKTFDAERGLEAPPLFTIKGDLDVTQASMVAKLTDNRSGRAQQVVFKPDIAVKDRPAFVFKFLGYRDEAEHRDHVTQIQVIDKNTKQVVQTLSGFDATPLVAAYYEDINFDGYFDLRMSLNSWGSNMSDEKYLYWLYDSATKRFKRSAQFEGQPGFLDTSFWCNELRFYGPNNFNYINGKMVPARDTYCRPWD